jgi:electron transport complex protein RnfA
MGFLFIIYIFSSLREKMNYEMIPESVRGVPISLITAGIMAMIISRFGGI